MMKIERGDWPLNVLVGAGWLLTVAGIGILFTRDAAPLGDGVGKVAIMSIVVCGMCWLGTRRVDRRIPETARARRDSESRKVGSRS